MSVCESTSYPRNRARNSFVKIAPFPVAAGQRATFFDFSPFHTDPVPQAKCVLEIQRYLFSIPANKADGASIPVAV